MNLGETGKNLSNFLVIIITAVVIIAHNHKLKIVNSIYMILGSMH